MSERRVTLSPGVERLVRAAAEPPRCATCKHWDSFGFQEGECFRIVRSDGQAPAPTIVTKSAPASLVTPADFGCTEHSPRLTSEDPQT